MGFFRLGKPRVAPRLRIVGRVNDGTTTVGYMLESLEAPGRRAYGDKSMVLTYAQQGYIENAKAARSGDKYTLRGIGTDLTTIPVIQRNKATDRMMPTTESKKPVYEVEITRDMVNHWGESGTENSEKIDRPFSELIKEGGSLWFHYSNGNDRGKPYKLDMKKALETTDFVKFDRPDGEYRVKMVDFTLTRTGELLYVGIALAMRGQPNGAIGICEYKVNGKVVASQTYAAFAAFGQRNANHVQSLDAAVQSQTVQAAKETEGMSERTRNYLRCCKETVSLPPNEDAEILFRTVKRLCAEGFGDGTLTINSACRENVEYADGKVCRDQYLFATNNKTGKVTSVVLTWHSGDDFLSGSDCDPSKDFFEYYQNYDAKSSIMPTAQTIVEYFKAILIDGQKMV